jgi:hypothetical protein
MVDLYPIPIRIIPSVRPTPQIVPLAMLQRWAHATGNPNAHHRDMAGITVPGIRLDTSSLQLDRTIHERRAQIRYRAGSLTIRVWNSIYLSDRLNECEQDFWEAHEMDHVHDYEQLSHPLMLRLQGNQFMREFFLEQTWYDENRQTITWIANRFETECAQIFQQLTGDAARHRDTPAEYERVRARIRETCTGRLRRPTRRASERG